MRVELSIIEFIPIQDKTSEISSYFILFLFLSFSLKIDPARRWPSISQEKNPHWRIESIIKIRNSRLRVPWTVRRSKQSIPKEINPEYTLERLMLKLTLQYFCHLMQRFHSLEKILMLGKMDGRKRRVWQRMRWLNAIINSVDMSFSREHCEMVNNRKAWQHAAVHGVAHHWVTEQQVHSHIRTFDFLKSISSTRPDD